MNMFRRDKGSAAQTPLVPPRPGPGPGPGPGQQEPDDPIEEAGGGGGGGRTKASQKNNNELNAKTKRTGLMGAMQQVNPFRSTSQVPSRVDDAPTSESREQGSDSTQRPGVLKGVMQKVNPFRSTPQVLKAASSESLDQERASDLTQSPGVLRGVMQKVNPFKSSTQVKTDPPDDHSPQETGGELQTKQNPGMISGMMHKVNPFKSSQPKETRLPHDDLSSSGGGFTEKQTPGTFRGMMQKVNVFSPSHSQGGGALHSEISSSAESLDDGSIQRHTVWYVDGDTSCEVKGQPVEAPKKRTMTFRMKRILPSGLFGSGTKDTLASPQAVEVQTLHLAEVPGEGTVLDPLDDEDGLLAWWRTVEGWDDWSGANENEEAEEVVEQAADRVFMAARLFVRFFNQRGASLQQRVLELLALADAADNFHKKTVTASVGGGVASIAGSVTTITGLILAPFTAGTSLIVTAVGIGVATAGGLASASANITDTVHSKTDRKKVEAMIQQYEEEMKDIRECLEFLQDGMETLEEWDFEKYAESISQKHLNQNVKHVMKEGGRAGKALVINTESLISTVQVLGVAGGAAKAAQVMSITTGVMAGLFLALDVFFLAKDSMELRSGAKTDFAAKIREVCKDLQDGLLQLNTVKEQLQRTMDGIEVEVEEEDEEQLKSDLKKLVELEE
uniref:Apolipoprotein L3-like n=1 Tax=Scophthalmus maximus TaxID=52904 RepID=A0A8D3AV09_SCOMX